jgi:hypothetical protein
LLGHHLFYSAVLAKGALEGKAAGITSHGFAGLALHTLAKRAKGGLQPFARVRSTAMAVPFPFRASPLTQLSRPSG